MNSIFSKDWFGLVIGTLHFWGKSPNGPLKPVSVQRNRMLSGSIMTIFLRTSVKKIAANSTTKISSALRVNWVWIQMLSTNAWILAGTLKLCSKKLLPVSKLASAAPHHSSLMVNL